MFARTITRTSATTAALAVAVGILCFAPVASAQQQPAGLEATAQEPAPGGEETTVPTGEQPDVLDQQPAETAGEQPAPTAGEQPAPTAGEQPPGVQEEAEAEPHKPPTVVLGLGGGIYIPTSKLGINFLVDVDAAYQLPWLGGRFGVGAGFAYSQPTTSGTIQDDRLPGGSADYSSLMREMVLDVRVTFRVFGWDSVWSPHVGLGPVVYFLSHEVESLSHKQTETSTEIGGLFVAGADFRIWHGAIVAEVRVPLAAVDQRTTGASNVGAVSVVVGYRFRL